MRVPPVRSYSALCVGLGVALCLLIGAESAPPAQADGWVIGGGVRDFVARQLRRSHGRYGEGRVPVTDVGRHEGRGSTQLEMNVEVDAGKCYVVLAAGVPSVRAIRIDVRDAYTNVRASAEPSDAPHTRFCPDLAGTWTISARIERGYGLVGAQVFGGAP